MFLHAWVCLIFCMCMIRGGNDILSQALNADRVVRKKLGGLDLRGWVHCFQTMNGGKHLFFFQKLHFFHALL